MVVVASPQTALFWEHRGHGISAVRPKSPDGVVPRSLPLRRHPAGCHRDRRLHTLFAGVVIKRCDLGEASVPAFTPTQTEEPRDLGFVEFRVEFIRSSSVTRAWPPTMNPQDSGCESPCRQESSDICCHCTIGPRCLSGTRLSAEIDLFLPCWSRLRASLG